MTDKQVIQTAIKILTHGENLIEESPCILGKLGKFEVKFNLYFGWLWLEVQNKYDGFLGENGYHIPKEEYSIQFSKSNELIQHLALIISLLNYDFFKMWMFSTPKKSYTKLKNLGKLFGPNL